MPRSKPFSPRATRLTVAEKAGVSPSTVSRALTGHPGIPAATREKVARIAGRLGYVPSALGRSYYQKKSYRIGVVIPYRQEGERVHTIQAEYFSKTIYGLIHSLKTKGYHVTVLADEGLGAKELVGQALEHSVDGFVLLGLKEGDPKPLAFQRQHIPFVMVHHYERGPGFSFVDIDSEGGYRELLAHLATKGVGRLVWVGGDEAYVNARDRDRIVTQLAPGFGMEIIGRYDGRYARSGGRDAALAMVASAVLPDAVLCANDRSAFGVLEVLREKGLAVPQKIKVAAFDNSDLSVLASPSLTTLDNPFFEIGRRAGDLMLSLLAGGKPEGIRVSPHLILRESTG